MVKDALFTGQPIFTQLLSFLNRGRIARLTSLHKADRYYKKFHTYDHLVTMLYAIFHNCTSIREVTTGMQACVNRLEHLGLQYCPRKSTLSDANRDRPADVFEAIFLDLYNHLHTFLPDSRSKAKWFSRLYVIDSTTISLFKEILKNAGRTAANGKRKGGIKVHTCIKAEEDVPCLVKMTAAAASDVPFIKKLKLPEGSIVAMDKGYADYTQFDTWTKEKVWWVTRMKKGAQYEIIEPLPISDREKRKGIQFDAKIILGHTTHNQITRTPARLIHFYDKEKDEIFYFITNNTKLNASTIGLIYKHRWQIELLFKRIKQSYPLQYFLGDNENAIRIQIWCALIADLLLKFVQSRLKRAWSFTNLASMVRIHLMTYIHLFKFLEHPDRALINDSINYNKGPTLFD
jgi:hypothetical protein